MQQRCKSMQKRCRSMQQRCRSMQQRCRSMQQRCRSMQQRCRSMQQRCRSRDLCVHRSVTKERDRFCTSKTFLEVSLGYSINRELRHLDSTTITPLPKRLLAAWQLHHLNYPCSCGNSKDGQSTAPYFHRESQFQSDHFRAKSAL